MPRVFTLGLAALVSLAQESIALGIVNQAKDPAAGPAAAPATAAAAKPEPTCGLANDAAAAKAAKELLIRTIIKEPVDLISTRHAVMIVPGDPMLGGMKAGRIFSALPRKIKDGESVLEFTKYVVVAATKKLGGIPGISIGSDVCGKKGFSDDDAAIFMRTFIPERFRDKAPRLFECSSTPKYCLEERGSDLDNQLPFLQGMSLGDLKGNLLPVMIQGQNQESGVELGDALAELVSTKGPWEAERVLFVFAGDLSHGLTTQLAEQCDTVLSKKLISGNPAETAKYLNELHTGVRSSWCKGDSAVPVSSDSLLAAMTVAKALKLEASRMEVSNTNTVIKEREEEAAQAAAKAAADASKAAPPASEIPLTVVNKPPEPGMEVITTSTPAPPAVNTGFATILFWEDARFVGERYSSVTDEAHADLIESMTSLASTKQVRKRVQEAQQDGGNLRKK
eukprot:TRINITY_DN557_c0_g1_i2.p1 TRINITY_DN557_c0_g1~~TRINITY_DN557_c0_g1_i2.p1  ORF type:complete len:452 (-),score=135.65 TRINITY_DN557_c0_g1_i2:120-1475(-)